MAEAGGLVHAMYRKVQLPRSNTDHMAATDWKSLVKQLSNIGSTHASAIVQRKLAGRVRLHEILARVAEMERIANERHRQMEYPSLSKLQRRFPNPRDPPRHRLPARVGALESHIAELEGQIELLHAEKSEIAQREYMLVIMIIPLQAESSDYAASR